MAAAARPVHVSVSGPRRGQPVLVMGVGLAFLAIYASAHSDTIDFDVDQCPQPRRATGVDV